VSLNVPWRAEEITTALGADRAHRDKKTIAHKKNAACRPEDQPISVVRIGADLFGKNIDYRNKRARRRRWGCAALVEFSANVSARVPSIM